MHISAAGPTAGSLPMGGKVGRAFYSMFSQWAEGAAIYVGNMCRRTREKACRTRGLQSTLLSCVDRIVTLVNPRAVRKTGSQKARRANREEECGTARVAMKARHRDLEIRTAFEA